MPPDHQLPSGANKVERIAQHTRGLVDDLTAWVDLKLKHTQLEVEEKVQRKIADVVVKVIPLVVFALCGLFLLVTIALGLGWWLGHPFWGFLIVTAGLGLTGLLLRRAAPSLKRRMTPDARARVSEDHLQPIDGSGSSFHR